MAGYDVSLIVCDGLGNDIVCGTKIIDVGSYKGNRFQRVILGTLSIYMRALKLDAEIYHFHDPELIPIGLLLKRKGKKVIFDIHENIVNQIKMKSWLPLRTMISELYFLLDYISSRAFYLILAEDSYAKIYNRLSKRYVIIKNMPKLTLFDKYIVTRGNKKGIFYIGVIAKERGIYHVLEALRILKERGIHFHFHCVGNISTGDENKISNKLTKYGLEDCVTFYGRLELVKGYQYSKECRVGVAILAPSENYKESYSTKMFEYMAAGMPVVTSNFPIYKNVVETNDCGICVDPFNAQEIARAIGHLMLNDEEANRMGKNGRSAVEEEYNWKVEKNKMFNLYEGLLKT
jgi:glycosyltransferase involved in cell wall biosynthesis